LSQQKKNNKQKAVRLRYNFIEYIVISFR